MTELLAPAKINLALVVGTQRPDGRHEVVTVLQRISLADRIALEPADELHIEGFAEDTIVRRALEQLGAAADTSPNWRVTIDKQIPVAAGLGGGSSDAAAALRLANAQAEHPLTHEALRSVAAQVGSDVPFFLEDGPRLATGDGYVWAAQDGGTELARISVANGRLERFRPAGSPSSGLTAGDGTLFVASEDQIAKVVPSNGTAGSGWRRRSSSPPGRSSDCSWPTRATCRRRWAGGR